MVAQRLARMDLHPCLEEACQLLRKETVLVEHLHLVQHNLQEHRTDQVLVVDTRPYHQPACKDRRGQAPWEDSRKQLQAASARMDLHQVLQVVVEEAEADRWARHQEHLDQRSSQVWRYAARSARYLDQYLDQLERGLQEAVLRSSLGEEHRSKLVSGIQALKDTPAQRLADNQLEGILAGSILGPDTLAGIPVEVGPEVQQDGRQRFSCGSVGLLPA